MDVQKVPLALRGRLGSEATAGLLQLLDESHEARREAVIAGCTERFERRLVEETAQLRVQMARMEANIRQDLTTQIATSRVEMLKWCFLFWVGQVLAIGGMLGAALRVMR